MSSSAPVIETTARHQVLLSQCAWCGAFEIAGRFVRVPRIGKVNWGLRLADAELAVTHGICPPCSEKTFGRRDARN
jgi:hypothetical protein